MAGVLPDRCLENGAKPRRKVFDLPVDICSNPNGHELSEVTKRMRSQIQVAKTSFLSRVTGPSLDRAQKRAAAPSCQVAPAKVVWHLIRTSPGHLPPDVFQACPTGRGRPVFLHHISSFHRFLKQHVFLMLGCFHSEHSVRPTQSM